MAKSKSDASLVSNSKLGQDVRALKHDLENTRTLKNKAIDILKTLREKGMDDVDRFLKSNCNELI